MLCALLAACSGKRAIESCADDLSGVWRADTGRGAISPADARGEPGRWFVVDAGGSLEAYPLFDDVPRGGSAVLAPRVIELVRSRASIVGAIHRRVMQRASSCDAGAAVVVTRCVGDAVDLELTDPLLPVGFAPCAWPPAPLAHRERWTRE